MMANKHLAKRKRSLKAMGRRGLSLFLSLVMTLSLVQIGAFAAGSDGTDQIGKYFEYDDKGKTTGEKLDSSLKSIDGDSITMQKNITAVDKDTFDINLIVTTKEKLEDIKLSPDAAVVIVLDSSSSMRYNEDGCGAYCAAYGHDNQWHGNSYTGAWPVESEQRLPKAKKAACDFVENFAKDADGAKRMVSVVEFNYDANSVIGWTDAAASTKNVDEIKAKINEIGTDSYTNIDAGLQLAYNLLGSDDVQNISSRFVILLTDGAPNAKADGAGNTSHVDGDDTSNANAATAAANTASSIKSDRKAAIYTLAFAAANATCYNGTVTTTHECTIQGWHRHGGDEREEYNYGDGTRGKLDNGTFIQHSYNHKWGCGCQWGWFNGPHTGSTTESKPVTIGEWLANSVASTGCARNATTGDQVSIGFEEIVKQIKTLLQAWQVTDPMAQYINYEGLVHPVSGRPATNSNVTYDKTQKTLTWNLWQEQPTSDGQTPATYTYSLTYRITLDTTIKGFEEEHWYPTNNVTSLTYAVNLLDSDGNLNPNANVKTDYFNVPSVKGDIPEYAYTIEYYLQDRENSAIYNRDYSEAGPETNLHETVTILDQDGKVPTEIVNKYNDSYYKFSKADPASIPITADESQNVIKVYYNCITCPITVNHYYRTDTMNADGTVTKGTYGTPDTDHPTAVVGGKYEASPKTQDGVYTLVTEAGDAVDGETSTLEINPVKPDGSDVLNLYYFTLETEAEVTLQENYETWEWQINPESGRYELVLISESEGTASTIVTDLTAPQLHTQKIDQEKEDGLYKLVGVTANGEDMVCDINKSISFNLHSGINPIVATYQKIIDRRGALIDVTINHIYTLNTYTADGDGLSLTTNPKAEAGPSATVRRYAGETYDFSSDPEHGYEQTYKGHTYPTPSAPSAITVVANPTAGQNEVNIYYNDSDYPDTATYEVVHHFRTWTSEIDATSGEVTWSCGKDDYTDSASYPAAGTTYYAGQVFPVVSTNPEGREGYTQDLMYDEGEFETRSDASITLVAGNNNKAHVYLDQKAGDPPKVGKITVKHEYFEDVLCVRNGVVTTDRRAVDSANWPTPVNYFGEIGDTKTISPVTSFGGKEYTRVDTSSLNQTYSATGITVVLQYVREGESELVETDLSVTHNYHVKNMTVQDGKADYYDAPVFEGSDTTCTLTDKTGNPVNTLYVGMEVTVATDTTYEVTNADESKTQYTYVLRGTPKRTLTLGATGTNSLELNYDRENPLAKVTVTVNHKYTIYTYTYVDGVQNITPTAGSAKAPVTAELYVGETYEAIPQLDGYTLDTAKHGDADLAAVDGKYQITVGETGNVVNFEYSKKSGDRASATVNVYHYYTEVNWDGTKTGYPNEGYEPEEQHATSYVGLSFTATPNLKADTNGENGYRLISKDATTDFISGTTIEVQSGTNEIHLYYSKSVDTRHDSGVSVRVTHKYYARDTYTVDESLSDAEYIASEGVTPEYATVTDVTGKENGVWIGATYTATKQPVYTTATDTIAYTFVNGTPSSLSVELSSDGRYDITINYIRNYSTDPGDANYTVVHKYYTDNSLDGSSSITASGKVGSSIDAANITKVTTYNGKAYSYSSASPASVTVTADGTATITLRYDYTTPANPGNGNGSTYYTVTVKYLDKETDKEIHQLEQKLVKKNTSYDMTQYDAIEIDGYTYDSTTGDPVKGIANSNKTITVYYVEAVDIPEIEIPNTDKPETEPTNPEVEPTEPETEPTEPDIDIGEQDVPKAEVPATGDNLMLWIMAAAVSGMGLAWLAITGRKRKEEEM